MNPYDPFLFWGPILYIGATIALALSLIHVLRDHPEHDWRVLLILILLLAVIVSFLLMVAPRKEH